VRRSASLRPVVMLVAILLGFVVPSLGPNARALAQVQGIPTDSSNGFSLGWNDLRLPEDEPEHVWRYRLRPPAECEVYMENCDFTPEMSAGDVVDYWFANPFHAFISGRGPLEVMVGIDGPANRCPLHAMEVSMSSELGNEDYTEGNRRSLRSRYRRLFPNGVHRRGLAVRLLTERGNAALPAGENAELQVPNLECELTVVLTRRFDRCVMYAEVAGDVSASFFGDVAYFNTFEEGAPIAYGNTLDPGTLELLDGLLEMANASRKAMGLPDEEMMCDENGENCEALEQPPPQSFEEQLRAWGAEDEAAGEEMPAGYGDSFGLTMTDVKFYTPAIDSYYNMNPGAGDRPGSAIAADQFDRMAEFSITASSPWNASGDGVVFGDGGVNIPLSTLYVLPGGIKFAWEPGGPGSAQLFIFGMEEDRIAGRVTGTLQSEKRFEQRYLNITVEAGFVALRGARSCQGQY